MLHQALIIYAINNNNFAIRELYQRGP